MSNVEAEPAVMRCGAPVDDVRQTGVPRVDVLPARDVPLGGPRSMTVRRTLPQRDRPLIGAWCFADHYGPDEVTDRGGMALPPHPHAGLQTDEDIVKAREDWEASSERFGTIEGFPGGRLPAPALPNATIRPRRNPPRR